VNRRPGCECSRGQTARAKRRSRSAPDKSALLREAQARGFRTYLYYIATEDPAINIQRVKNRVAEGGHDVPETKIVARYHRSLGLLAEAIRYSSRAFFFDTSDDKAWYFAEAADGTTIELKSDEMPVWFEPIWNHFRPEE
jgi:predicted ABC-type ATPase